MLKGKKILILGAGQIGEACAMQVLKDGPKLLVLHTLTREEANVVVSNLKKLYPSSKTKLIPSWGNIFVPSELTYIPKQELVNNENHRKALIDYYYSPLTDRVVEESALYKIIQTWKPDVIIDGINSATVVGYQDDPYSLPREVIKHTKEDDSAINWKDQTIKLLTSAIIPSLVRFTQILQKSMVKFNSERYVKISTTGLGGMGVNLCYTHGDVNEPGMSSGILGKVAAAGVMHQLFWSLAHTPGIDIKVIVPAALVGWQPVQFGKFRSHGKNLPLIDTTEEKKLRIGGFIELNNCKIIKKTMEMPFVDSGENSAYSLAEMTAITALGQMGCVTREEVALAAYEAANGSVKYDILTAMDHVSLGPSFPAAFQREVVLQKLAKLEKDTGVPSIATNNLGPTVSKNLFELYILLASFDNSLDTCIKTSNIELAKKATELIRKNQLIRSQILSLGLPIILEDNKLLIGEYYLVPDIRVKQKINIKNIEQWAESGWIDLRQKRMDYWKSQLKMVAKDVKQSENSCTTILDKNWHNIRSANIGEILAYIYSLQNGGRKIR